MSAAVMEPTDEKPRKKVNRKTEKDRVQVLLKPHVRMCIADIAEEEGVDSLGLMGRELIMEALEARGHSPSGMLAEWHKSMSEHLLNGKTHPFAK